MKIVASIAEVWDGKEVWVAIDDDTYDGDIQGVGGSREIAIEDLLWQLEEREDERKEKGGK